MFSKTHGTLGSRWKTNADLAAVPAQRKTIHIRWDFSLCIKRNFVLFHSRRTRGVKSHAHLSVASFSLCLSTSRLCEIIQKRNRRIPSGSFTKYVTRDATLFLADSQCILARSRTASHSNVFKFTATHPPPPLSCVT